MTKLQVYYIFPLECAMNFKIHLSNLNSAKVFKLFSFSLSGNMLLLVS